MTAAYPVEADFEIRLPEGTRRVRLTPVFDAQELDWARHGDAQSLGRVGLYSWGTWLPDILDRLIFELLTVAGFWGGVRSVIRRCAAAAS
jgi:hypothetical protein